MIGGNDGFGWTTAVELFDIENRVWFDLTDLPQPIPNPSAAIIVGMFIHVTGYGAYGYTGSLFRALPVPHNPLVSRPSLSWKPLPSLPVTWSKPISKLSILLIIGGKGKSSLVTSIYQLMNEQWVEIGSIALNRKDCLVTNSSSVASGRVLVVGGRCVADGLMQPLDLVEDCTFICATVPPLIGARPYQPFSGIWNPYYS